MAFDKDLPDELQGGGDSVPMSEPDKATKLDALSLAIAQKRDAAVKARKESGIEEVWRACEEAYLCIDDSNRAEFANAKWAKPTSLQGPLTAETTKQDTTKSSAYVRLTPRYVDAGYAKISEIILPIDDKPFSFGPSPDPELIKSKGDTSQYKDANGQPIMRPAKPEEMQGPVEPGQAAPQVPVTHQDIFEKLMAQAVESAEKAEKRVYDWMVECNYPAEMRKVIFDSSRIGVGVLKGPFPSLRKGMALKNKAVQITHKVAPALKWIDPWNFFPDGACGEDIYDGDHCFERDFLTESKLKALKRERDTEKNPIYMGDQIDKVILEGPGKCNVQEGGNPTVKPKDGRYTIWYMVGTLDRKDMETADAAGIKDLPDELTDVHAIVTMVNDTVIRVTINPLDTGKFGYHAMPWSRRAGHWAGVGVAEQVSLPQRMVNAGTRALLNNGGLSSGVQIIMDQMAIVPADTDWKITPNKIWYKADGANLDDVRKAFMSVTFPNVGDAMMAIIQYAFKLAEEASNIPLVSQGQVNQDTPDTFGAVELQNSNANTLLRSLAYGVDDHVTVRVVNELYEYLLLDPNVPDDEKGDFEINARGSIAMVEKAIQEKTMLQAGGLTQNPAYGIDPKKWFSEYWKTKRLDPRKIQFSEEELAKMAAQPPQPPPQIAVAQINAQKDLKKTEMVLGQKDKQAQEDRAADGQIASMDNQTEQFKVQQDTDRDTVYVQAQAKRDADAHAATMAELNTRERIAMLEYSNKRGISFEQAKVHLAETTIKVQAQKDLSAAALAVDVHKHQNPAPQVLTPPTEPAGRAPDGESFQA